MALASRSKLATSSPVSSDAPRLNSPPAIICGNGNSRRLSEFQYTPLPRDGEYIRVLELHPGGQHEYLSCDLKLLTLAEEATYEALSYVWGDGEPVSIECCGQRLSIKPNLFNALWTFRHPTKTLRLWADAICINQRDLNERAQQVKIMHKVYSKAPLVRVWFGLDEENKAPDLFRLIKEFNEFLEPMLMDTDFMLLQPSTQMRLQEMFLSNGSLKPRLKQLLADFVWDNPWIRRVWVQQEIGLAQDCDLYSGDSFISACDFMKFALTTGRLAVHEEYYYLRPFMDGLELVLLSCLEIWSFYDSPSSWQRRLPDSLRAYLADGEQPAIASFMRLLLQSRRLSATVKHDHLYAFLGHPACHKVLGSSTDAVPIDYELPIEDLFLKLAVLVLQETNSLVIVSLLGDYDAHKQSWVPRWDQVPAVHPMTSSFDATYGWDASRWQRQYLGQRKQTSGLTFDVSCNSLFARGVLVDYVEARHVFPDFNEYHGFGRPRFSTFEDLWRAFDGDEGESPYGDPWQAFAWCLVEGKLVNRARGEDRDWKELESSLYGFVKTRCSFTSKEVERCFPSQNLFDKTSPEVGARDFIYNADRKLGRVMFRTATGLLGLCHKATRPGDLCCVLIGAPVPAILRDMGNNQYHLIGDCYLHGYMDGEAIDGWEAGKLESRVFEIV